MTGYIKICNKNRMGYTVTLYAIIVTRGRNLFNSYTIGTRGLPDIYTLSPQAYGPQASGVYIRQTTSAHGITTM